MCSFQLSWSLAIYSNLILDLESGFDVSLLRTLHRMISSAFSSSNRWLGMRLRRLDVVDNLTLRLNELLVECLTMTVHQTGLV